MKNIIAFYLHALVATPVLIFVLY